MSNNLEAFRDQFLGHIKYIKNYSPHTLRNYKYEIDKFIDFKNETLKKTSQS